MITNIEAGTKLPSTLQNKNNVIFSTSEWVLQLCNLRQKYTLYHSVLIWILRGKGRFSLNPRCIQALLICLQFPDMCRIFKYYFLINTSITDSVKKKNNNLLIKNLENVIMAIHTSYLHSKYSLETALLTSVVSMRVYLSIHAFVNRSF